ncbi:VOC family protein [Glutamicibacter mishrai]|uniref:VOC family protein n=1 Tax=Glutamicibacter mishrai TaxID=1775880 RepID=UPI003F79F623
MSSLMIYVLFPGNAREAMNFYAGIFGGDLKLFTLEQFNRTDGDPQAIAHSELKGLVTLAGADATGDQASVKSEGLMLSLLGTAEPKVLHQWFEQLSVGGQVLDPLAVKPWGDTDGQVVDRYGLRWLIGYQAENSESQAPN